MKKPNILFILLDDMGWKDLACTGSTFYETPNIDRLPRGPQAEQKNKNRVEACLHDRQPVFIFLFGEADKRDAATLSLSLFFPLQGAESSLALLIARPSPGRAEK